MTQRLVSATEFKAKCLALLDEIHDNGSTITVTKRGLAVATVGPAVTRLKKSSEGSWAGKVNIPDELLTAERSDSWDVLSRQ